MRKLLKNHRGVSMVEVLITVAILAIVVAPCLAAFVTAQRGNVLAKETAAQYTEASNLMEKLKAAAQDPNGDGLTNLTNDISRYNYNGASLHIKYQVIDEPITKQEPETPEMHEEAPQNPTSHVVFQVKTYVNVWICSGVRDDQVPPSDYILSGVITPNIAAENQASDLINELATAATIEDVLGRLAEEADKESFVYVLYRTGSKEGANKAEEIEANEEIEESPDSSETDEPDETNKSTQVEVWIYAGTDKPNRPLAADEDPPADCILHGVIEFDSLNDSIEDPIESQADTQT